MLTFKIYDPAEDVEGFLATSALTIRQFLASPPGWRPDPLKTLLFFDALSESQNEEINNFGYLDHLVPQFIEAAERLRQGRFALLRTAGDHEACWLILEPAADVVLLSCLGMLDEFGWYFPLARSPMYVEGVTDQRPVLYDYVEKKRGVLHSQALSGGHPQAIKDVAMPRAALLPALLEQAALGTQLLVFLQTH